MKEKKKEVKSEELKTSINDASVQILGNALHELSEQIKGLQRQYNEIYQVWIKKKQEKVKK